jgi:hypothetical protein
MMRNIMFCLILLMAQGSGPVLASDPIAYDTPIGPEDVRIGPHYIEMPLNKIFLIRNGELYGAVKLTKFRMGTNKKDKYASYICWYQDDGTGDLVSKSVKFEEKEASSKLFGIGRFSFNTGNEEIRCGAFRLWWWGKGMIYFFEKGQEFGDYGVELAPTKWSEIKEVNVFDTRLKWIKYDKNRSRTDIPIDNLW